ncbi:MAG: xanthine dehydrogenase family protein subunit M [Burkholderiales bacterium]|nr:xanthine dehydrogenase family protein subunit M [Burkholderiales bacterium]
MKAPAFDYAKPAHLAEAFALLARYGDEAKLLAGGQSLLAALNLRLSEPSLLIDLSCIDALRGITLVGSKLRIGALTTHTAIESSPLVAQHAPLLTLAAPHIAHRAIRNLGTIGGSIAYADPAAEWPTCALALDAAIVVASASGERRVAAADFFQGLYQTDLQPGEIVSAVEVPVRAPHQWCQFSELARRHGDYAIVGLAAVAVRQANTLTQARLVLLGVGAVPLRAHAAEQLIEGKALSPARVDQAVDALRDSITPVADLTSSAETKRHLAGVLLKRILSPVVSGV